MAKLSLGTYQHDMPLALNVSDWNVLNTSTTGQAFQPGRAGSPTPNFRTDRIDFTGTTLYYNVVDTAHGVIDTLSYKSYGAPGYVEQFKFSGLNVGYKDVVNNKADIMPLLLKGNDTITGNAFGNALHGFAGNDTVDGGAGNDQLFGDKGNDTLLGGEGDDQLVGGEGADRLDGGVGADTASYATSSAAVSASLLTGKGTFGDAKGDTFVAVENLTGSNFNDTLIGNGAANTLAGQAGSDALDGGKGNDLLDGGAGNDTIIGGAGNDEIIAGSGKDQIWLGAGSDVLHFAPADQITTVNDFDIKADHVDVSSFDAIDANNFQSFLHDTKTGCVLDLGHGDTLVFVGVHAAELQATDFVF